MFARLKSEIFNMWENDSKVFTVITNRQDGSHVWRKRRWLWPCNKMKRGEIGPCFVNKIVDEPQVTVDTVREGDSQQYKASSYTKYTRLCCQAIPGLINAADQAQ